MCAASLRFLRAGPPPPKVVLLPDALFFVRVVPVSAGSTAEAAAAQVELALEATSPFPLAQLYYGWLWTAGAEHALVYAAYRRRFTSEQTSTWGEAELVLPTFAALAGVKAKPATTIILSEVEGLTAVHWEDSGFPTKVLFRPIPPEAEEEVRLQVREDLLRTLGGSREVIDLAKAPVPDATESDGEIVFQAEGLTSQLAAPVAASLDVRDKAELAALRGARRRDITLWRVAVGCAAAVAFLLLGEVALLAGKAWQDTRKATVAAQQPTVEQIMKSQSLAIQIDELVTKRLLPFEMLAVLAGENDTRRLPADVVFTRAYTQKDTGIYTLFVSGTTKDINQLNTYQNALRQQPAIQSVEETRIEARGGDATFDWTVSFKPGFLQPMTLPGTVAAQPIEAARPVVTNSSKK